MWLLWDSFSVKWTWTKSFQCCKICRLSSWSGFCLTSTHSHFSFFFISRHSSSLLLYTLRSWPPQTHLLADPINLHPPSPTYAHKPNTHWSWEKKQAWNIEPILFFYISWLALLFPQTLSRLHDRLIGSIAVKMEYWCSAFVLAQSWIKR